MPIAARRAEANKGPVIFALDRNRKACEGFYIAPNNEAAPPSGGQRPSGPNHHPKLGGADGRQRLDHSLSRKSLKRLGRIVARIDAVSALMKVADPPVRRLEGFRLLVLSKTCPSKCTTFIAI